MRTRCAAGCTGSARLASTGSVTAGAGRKRRITEAQRSAIIALARSVPPGRLARDADGELSADDEHGPGQWTLDTLAETARDAASRWAAARSGGSCGREGPLASWRTRSSAATRHDTEFAPKEPASWSSTPPTAGRLPSWAPTSSAPSFPHTFTPRPAGAPDDHRIKAPLEYSRGPEKTWVYGGLRIADGHAITMCASSRNSAGYQASFSWRSRLTRRHDHVITDNLSSHNSVSTRAWLEDHPAHPARVHPQGRLLAQPARGWWRIFRRQALAGQTSPTPTRSTTPPPWQPPSSTPAPALGSGDDPAQATLLPPALYIHPLRNLALVLQQRAVMSVGAAA